MRAAYVNGYDSLPPNRLLRSCVARGASPGDPYYEVGESIGGLTNIYFVGYIELPTELRSHVTAWASG